jgi:hypothetical protein
VDCQEFEVCGVDQWVLVGVLLDTCAAADSSGALNLPNPVLRVEPLQPRPEPERPYETHLHPKRPRQHKRHDPAPPRQPSHDLGPEETRQRPCPTQAIEKKRGSAASQIQIAED